MTTQLERPIRREVWIDNKPYTLTINAEGFTLVEKRRRKGTDLRWKDLITSRDGTGNQSRSVQAGASTGSMVANSSERTVAPA